MGNNKNKELNILLLINNLRVGGAEIVFSKLFEYLKLSGFKVFLATVDCQEPIKNENCGIPDRISLPVCGSLDFNGYGKIIKFCKKNGINVIFSTLDHANVVARIVKIFAPYLKVIVRESGVADRKSIKLKILDIILNFFCNKIIAVSKEVKDTLTAYQPFYKNKMEVINNGVEILMLEEDILNNINNKSGRGFRILNVGNMNSDNKNQMELIDAVYELVKSNRCEDLKLELVGDGFLKSKLEQKTKSLGLKDRVSFPGQVNHSKISKFYLSADLFVLNSKKEGFSNALLEAMSFGLPVISTKTGGASEAIDNGKSGFLVEINDREALIDRIERLANNLNLRREIGMMAYRTVKTNYSAEAQFKKIVNTFKNEF